MQAALAVFLFVAMVAAGVWIHRLVQLVQLTPLAARLNELYTGPHAILRMSSHTGVFL